MPPIQNSAISIVDMHADIPWDVNKRRRDKKYAKRSVLDDQHFHKLKSGGIAGFNSIIWVESEYKPHRALRRGLEIIDSLYEDLTLTENFALATTGKEFEKIVYDGKKIGMILGVEGGELIEESLAVLRDFHRLGLRSFGFVWNERNQLADGYGEVNRRNGGSGLSELGKSVVEECNKLGIILDGAHITPNGLSDILELSKDPIIVSHGSTTANKGTLRPLSDEHLKMIAKNDGVAGIFCVNYKKSMPTLDVYLDHIEHAIRVAGLNHVGIGFDYCDYIHDIGSSVAVKGLEDHSKSQNVVRGLRRRGFRDADIEKLAKQNFLRVLKEVA
ncbi:MAG: membrane dipeptidase [Nitrososphaerota archaeon]|nr:membrane dipeptidase [Nitrososphaerota archaeon]